MRRVLRISWKDMVRNEEIWRRTGQGLVENDIGRRRWRWIGHTLRKDDRCIARKSLEWNPQGSRTTGRPQSTWRRCVEKDRKRSGKSWNDVKKMAKDRDEWRIFVYGLYPAPGW